MYIAKLALQPLQQEIVLLSPEHHVCIFSSFAGSQKKIALSQKCGPNLHALCWNLAYCNIEDQRSVLSFLLSKLNVS